MKRLLVLLGFLLLPANLSAHASAVDFSKWAVLIVAGDNRAQSGGPTQVFDNARKDLVKAFTGAGFAAANIEQFAVNHDNSARPAEIGSIAGALWDLSSRAPAGCLIYFTSHGTPDGIGVGNAVVSPGKVAAMINNSCGDKPAVIVMSACYSGQFVPVLARDSRIVITAARPDRTSFGCGELDQLTYFDDCFLRAMPKAEDFAGLGGLVQQCVTFREKQMKAEPPSEPQVSVGPQVAFTLRWK
jgi:Peptidase C13 family